MERLDATMEVLDGKIQEGTARSNANYLSFFEDKSEELYRLHYMYKCLNDLRSNIRKLETPQQIQEYIQRRRNVCLDKLLEQDISAGSTSPMSNLAHTLRSSVRSSLSVNMTCLSVSLLQPHDRGRKKNALQKSTGIRCRKKD